MSAAPARDPLYREYRFPAEIIAHAVWLHSRFHLSHRDIEDRLAERKVEVSYEAIRLWCRTFGPDLATGLRRHRRRVGGTWHLDEVQLKIKRKKHWLWRAVDQDGLSSSTFSSGSGATSTRPSGSCAGCLTGSRVRRGWE